MTLDILFSCMKGEMIQEGIYESFFWGKFFIKERKGEKKFVALVVHVN